jgi:hypothetical protein
MKSSAKAEELAATSKQLGINNFVRAHLSMGLVSCKRARNRNTQPVWFAGGAFEDVCTWEVVAMSQVAIALPSFVIENKAFLPALFERHASICEVNQ